MERANPEPAQRPEKRPRLLDPYYEEAGPSGRDYISATSSAALSLLSSRLNLPQTVLGVPPNIGALPSHAHSHSHLGVGGGGHLSAGVGAGLGLGLGAGPGHTGASLLSLGPLAAAGGGAHAHALPLPSSHAAPPPPPAPHPMGYAVPPPLAPGPSHHVVPSQHVPVPGHHPASPPWRGDDKDGHYVFELGDNLTPRYKILSKLGEGTFGRVLECWDRQMQEYVAVKVIRNVQKYRDAAMIEIEVLSTLAKHDKLSQRGCVELKGWFDYRGHVCIVFEKLGPSLYDFLRKNNYRPFSVDMARDFSRQLLESVAYMHELTLIHTDLKPENILLLSSEYIKVPDYKSGGSSSSSSQAVRQRRVPTSSDIRVIDFGSATFDSHYHCSIVSTRHYRAPEVILGMGWTYPCDIWSIGCIIVELVTGEALFQTHENLEHLAMMERLLGPIPSHLVKKVDRRAEKYFRSGRELNWPEGAVSRESIRAVKKLPRLRDLIMQCVEHSAGTLIDLLYNLLRFDPSQRLTARDALKHAFFREPSRRML